MIHQRFPQSGDFPAFGQFAESSDFRRIIFISQCYFHLILPVFLGARLAPPIYILLAMISELARYVKQFFNLFFYQKLSKRSPQKSGQRLPIIVRQIVQALT